MEAKSQLFGQYGKGSSYRNSQGRMARSSWFFSWSPKPCSQPIATEDQKLIFLCTDIAIEFGRSYNELTKLVTLENPNFLANPEKKECWIKFGVSESALKELKVSHSRLLQIIGSAEVFCQVKSSIQDILLFESNPKKCDLKDKPIPFKLFETEIKKMNLYTYLEFDEMVYSIPLQS
jgi:hypothetical protein